LFGSLLGSNLGAFLYERMLARWWGPRPAAARTTLFWSLFAALDVVAVVGLILFGAGVRQDTPDTRRRARRVMFGVHG